MAYKNEYTSEGQTLVIDEIFASIQGEGRYMGCPVVFVRTSGCPVRCDFCDSKHSWQRGRTMTVSEIFAEVRRCSKGKIKTVVITGGEPLVQQNLYRLCEILRYEAYSVHLETSGGFEVPIGRFDWVVASPKPNLQYAIKDPDHVDELKLVIGSHVTDIYKLLNVGYFDRFAGRIWLQPCDEVGLDVGTNMKRCYEMAMKDPRFRVGIQLHKILGVA